MNKSTTKPGSIKSDKKNVPFVYISVILVVTFLAFSTALSNEFVNWDDFAYITENPILSDFSLKNILHVFNFKTHVVGNYHPLTVLTNMIEYRMVGAEPFLYHFDNLLLHLLNVLLVGIIVFKLTSRFWATIIATALFAVHPMRVESVVWAAERKDVLYTFFFLIALYQYIRYITGERKSALRHAASIFFFLLSLLSKGQAVVFSMVLLLVDYWFDRKFDKKLLLEKIPFFILSIGFGLLATKAQASSMTEERMVHYVLTDRIFFASYNLLAYPFKLIFPFNLSCFYGYPVKSEMFRFYLALPVLILLLGIVFWKYRKNKPAMFGTLFFLLTICIVIQLLPIGNAIIADRYTYVPYLGLFLMIGLLADQAMTKWPGFGSAIKATVILVCVVFSFKSFEQSRTWNNSETLWLQALKVNEKEPVVNNNLAAFYIGTQQPEKALPLLETCVTNSETYLEVYKAYNNLGGAYKDLKAYDKAIQAFTQSLKIEKKYTAAIFNRGLTYSDMQMFDESIADFTNLLSIDSLNSSAYYSRAIAYKGKGDLQKSIADYEKTIELNPQFEPAYTNLGNLYFSLKDYGRAVKYYDEAINLNPEGNVFLNRSKANFFSGKYAAAKEDYERAAGYGASEPAYFNAIMSELKK